VECGELTFREPLTNYLDIILPYSILTNNNLGDMFWPIPFEIKKS
jgi:hypothetical protein